VAAESTAYGLFTTSARLRRGKLAGLRYRSAFSLARLRRLRPGVGHFAEVRHVHVQFTDLEMRVGGTPQAEVDNRADVAGLIVPGVREASFSRLKNAVAMPERGQAAIGADRSWALSLTGEA
jgi:hypothetical protein